MKNEELRKKQIELFSSVLNKNKITNRANGCTCSDIRFYDDRVIIDNVVIGYIKPKDTVIDLDFDYTNLKLITVEIRIEKDLNGEGLRFWVNNGTFEVVDMDNFDELEYTERMLENWDKESLYDLLDRYDCSPSDLAERYLDDLGIECVVGDLYIQNIEEEYGTSSYGIKWSSLQGLDSILKDIKEDEQAILFDNALNIINDLETYYGRDLTDDDLYNIGVLVNKLFKTDFDGVGALEYVLRECDYLED